MKKISLKTILMYIFVAAAIFASRDTFDGLIAFGIFVGGVYCGNPIVVSLLYIASSAIYGVTPLVVAGVRVAVVGLFLLIHKLIKRKIGKGLLLLYVLLANVFYCVYGFTDWFNFFDKLLYTVVGAAFSFVCVYVYRAVFTRGLAYRPALDELICISVYAAVFSYCLGGISVGGLDLLGFIAPYAVLFCVCALGDEAGLLAAVLAGIGATFASGVFDGLAFYVLAAAFAVALNKLNRYAAALSIVVLDVVMAYFFDIHGAFNVFVLIPSAVSVLLFIVTPTRLLVYVRDMFGGNAEKFAGKSIVNKLRLNLSRKLYQLSDVFLSMKNTFSSMTVGTVSRRDAEVAIAKQVSETVCRDCDQRSKCWRTDLEKTEQNFLSLTSCSLERGKSTILDVPHHLSVRCDRLNALLSAINSRTASYTAYYERAAETNNSRMLIGEQLGGVSGIMRQLALDCKGKVVFDTQKEKEITERLIFHNILTGGAVLIEQPSGLSVILTVAQKDVDGEAICKIVSPVIKQNMCVEKIESTDSKNWMNVYLAVQPRFALSFGVRGTSKAGSDASGDTHSFIKIDTGKYMIALCDGMGSGSAAEKMSATAISLVENFYRAGFDNDVILSCVNKLLAGSGNEVFCAVDICVVDLYNGLVDFIKLGAADGLVKSNKTVQIVSGSSLPLGVLEEMKPSVTKKALSSGDMLLLASDGFNDCFRDPDLLAETFDSVTLTNPQTVADEMMDKALELCSDKPQDDMTVIVARLV